jgi:hypothetical protein
MLPDTDTVSRFGRYAGNVPACVPYTVVRLEMFARHPADARSSSDGPKRTRRALLASTTAMLSVVVPSIAAYAREIGDVLPWTPFAADPPDVPPGEGWRFFTPEEAAALETVVERLIPGDELSPSGTDVGCAVFIDRQLAWAYGDERICSHHPAAVPRRRSCSLPCFRRSITGQDPQP